MELPGNISPTTFANTLPDSLLDKEEQNSMNNLFSELNNLPEFITSDNYSLDDLLDIDDNDLIQNPATPRTPIPSSPIASSRSYLNTPEIFDPMQGPPRTPSPTVPLTRGSLQNSTQKFHVISPFPFNGPNDNMAILEEIIDEPIETIGRPGSAFSRVAPRNSRRSQPTVAGYPVIASSFAPVGGSIAGGSSGWPREAIPERPRLLALPAPPPRARPPIAAKQPRSSTTADRRMLAIHQKPSSSSSSSSSSSDSDEEERPVNQRVPTQFKKAITNEYTQDVLNLSANVFNMSVGRLVQIIFHTNLKMNNVKFASAAIEAMKVLSMDRLLTLLQNFTFIYTSYHVKLQRRNQNVIIQGSFLPDFLEVLDKYYDEARAKTLCPVLKDRIRSKRPLRGLISSKNARKNLVTVEQVNGKRTDASCILVNERRMLSKRFFHQLNLSLSQYVKDVNASLSLNFRFSSEFAVEVNQAYTYIIERACKTLAKVGAKRVLEPDVVSVFAKLPPIPYNYTPLL